MEGRKKRRDWKRRGRRGVTCRLRERSRRRGEIVGGDGVGGGKKSQEGGGREGSQEGEWGGRSGVGEGRRVKRGDGGKGSQVEGEEKGGGGGGGGGRREGGVGREEWGWGG